MANIKNKNIEELSEWNAKELRKLRITLNNRIASLKSPGKDRELPESHILFEMTEGDCENLLLEVKRAEKALSRQD